MKNLAIILLLITCAVLGGVIMQQKKQAARDAAWINELQKKVDGATVIATKAGSAEKKVRELRSKLGETASQAAQKSSQVAQLQEKLASAGTNDSPMKGFAEMFKSPEIKGMMQKQQRAMAGPMVESSYSPYFRQLKLNDEQKSYLKDLLAKKMMVNMESGLDLIAGDTDNAKQKEAVEKMKATTDAYDQQIKDFLGKENYAQFEEYEKTLPERMQLGQYTAQLPDGARLSSDQEQQLVQLMTEERTQAPNDWVKNMGKNSSPTANMKEMFTEENIAKFAEEKEKVDQRVLARAQKILSTEQYSTFQDFLTMQREMQAMGMKMGAKMFGTKDK